ncbi:MAG: hypothetical protein GX558_05155 [Clostridiales bacterium]|nr:hypothetical protein [Clostridiales bacterium]
MFAAPPSPGGARPESALRGIDKARGLGYAVSVTWPKGGWNALLSRLKAEKRVVGAKELARAIESGRVAVAYLAADTDLFVNRRVRELCREKNVPIVEVSSMKELGEACGLSVGAASAGVLKQGSR